MFIKYYDYFSYIYGMQVSNRHNITANCNRTVTKLLTILGKNDKKKWEACFINSPYTRRGRGMESTAIFLRTRFKYGIPVCERERRVPLTLRHRQGRARAARAPHTHCTFTFTFYCIVAFIRRRPYYLPSVILIHT